MCRALVLAVFAVGGVAGCHAIPALEMGDEAVAAFRYRDKPIHPLCLNFSLEAASDRPIALAACSGRTPVTRDGRGWLTAEFPSSEGRGQISYRVLAARGARFLIAKDVWSGGTGQFSTLSWVQLRKSEVVDDAPVHGGDRCAGGLLHVMVDSLRVRYDASTNALQILQLADVTLPDTVADQMRWAYSACDGYATYVYDPLTEKSRLAAVTLRPHDTPEASGASSANDAEACFEALVRERVANQPKVLTPVELRELGNAFATRCTRGR